jgi:hypothetical protein
MRIAVLLLAIVSGACARAAGGSDSAQDDTARAETDPLAASDCVRGEPEPALAVAARPRFERTGKLAAVEEARLDDTTSVRITHGGCAHYVETYAFTVRGAVRDTTDSRYWLARAADYLRALPAVEERKPQLDQMIAAVEAAAKAETPYAYGEPIRASEMALVWFTVRRPQPGTALIEIVFDVAL